MVAGCGNKCVKYFFFLINFLFFVLGGVVCGLALWIRFDNNFQNKVFSALNGNNGQNGLFGKTIQLDTLYIILYVIAAIGLVVFILGFFGCCGSCMESVCALGIYFTFVLILFVVLLAGGIYVLINKPNLRNDFVTLWRTELVDKYTARTIPQDVINNVDYIQQSLKCCGATGCTDFSVPPQSCNCTSNALPFQSSVPGCATSIFDAIDSHFTYVIIIAAIILVVELIGMILSCILCSAVKEKASINF